MECRFSLTTIGRSGMGRWVGRWSLVLAPLLALGCFPQSATLPVSSPSSRIEHAPEENAHLPKRVPKPNTCMEAGKLREQKADEPDTPGPEKAVLLDEARKAYQQALKIDPTFDPAARALAGLYMKENNYDNAVATYQKILKSH